MAVPVFLENYIELRAQWELKTKLAWSLTNSGPGGKLFFSPANPFTAKPHRNHPVFHFPPKIDYPFSQLNSQLSRSYVQINDA